MSNISDKDQITYETTVTLHILCTFNSKHNLEGDMPLNYNGINEMPNGQVIQN